MSHRIHLGRDLSAFLLVLTLCFELVYCGNPSRPKAQANATFAKTSKVKTSGLFSPNSIGAYLQNDGVLFNNPSGTQSGLVWPRDSTTTLAYTAGLWVIGRSSLDGQLHSACSDISDFGNEYQAGPIVGTYHGDTLAIPSLLTLDSDESRNLMILSKWSMTTDSTYGLWTSGAVPGAPLTRDGRPEIVGDWAAYWVMNDLNLAGRQAVSRTSPMGLEVENYIFGSNDQGAVGNTIFLRMRIINKSTIRYDSTYIGFFADPDVGDPTDDYAGCDTVRGLGYAYNGEPFDAEFLRLSPSVGFDLLEGPQVPSSSTDSGYYNGRWERGCRNLPMTAFFAFPWPWADYRYTNWIRPIFVLDSYGMMQGRTRFGPMAGPGGVESTFMDSGDPVSGTGWLESWELSPSDIRILLSSGPLTLQPSDTQEVTIACLIGQGTDRLNSITVLKHYDDLDQLLLNAGALAGVKSPPQIPQSFALFQNYPNPFNPSTNISFSIPRESFVSLNVYDALGREVATLASSEMQAGNYTVRWDARNASTGVYFYRLRAGSYNETRKLLLLR